MNIYSCFILKYLQTISDSTVYSFKWILRCAIVYYTVFSRKRYGLTIVITLCPSGDSGGAWHNIMALGKTLPSAILLLHQ